MIELTDDVLLLLTAIGAPYWWGRGDLTTAWADVHDGVDCSGFAQMALRDIGVVRRGAWHDLSAHDLANACDPVSAKTARVGDLHFYRSHGTERISHVTVSLGGGMCIGANGGRSDTTGNNPRACVQVRPYGYRYDLLVTGRIKPKWRPDEQ